MTAMIGWVAQINSHRLSLLSILFSRSFNVEEVTFEAHEI